VNKIVLGDNQAIFRAGIAKVLASKEDFRVAAQCSDLAQMTLAVDTHRSSIVIFASALKPDMLNFMTRVKAAGSRAIVIAEDGESASFFTSRGIRGVVYRDITDAALLDCVYKVLNGLTSVQRAACTHTADEDFVGVRVRNRLTPKEVKIVGLIVQGCKNKHIAQRLGTTEQVIKNYLRSIYDKIGVSDRLELALFTLHHETLATAAAEAVKDIPAPLKVISTIAVQQMQPA
jgi:DNA-binding NarL/FixJ family response regulator